MNVDNIRICGIENPLGYDLSDLRVSWVVEGDAAVLEEQVQVTRDAGFEDVLWETHGAGLDHLCTPISLELLPRTRYHVRVSATDDAGQVAQGTAFFETAKLDEEWAGAWIGPREDDDRPPVFSHAFGLDGPIASARLYISGLGLFHATLNGRDVTDETLTPYFSDYHREVQYLSFDVTDLLDAHNVLDVTLGNGWYKGTFGLKREKNNFGDRYALIAELRVRYADGREAVIATDPSWTYQGSDLEEDGIYDGERINRLLWAGRDNPKANAVPIHPEGALVARRNLPVEPHEALPATLVETPAGEQVLDFGQNFAGFVEFASDGLPEGCEVTLDFGEILQDGSFYNANYRHAKSQFSYVADGCAKVVRPHFTFFGFRYCRVSGWPGAVDAGSFVGRAIYTRMRQTGSIETGNSLVNRLFLNALWGQRSNSVDFPTDCPQRDERLGWTGDAQVFAGTACYNMEARGFYGAFAHNLRVAQEQYEGVVPGVIPVLGGAKPIYSSVWGDIATILPTALYTHYGDRAQLLRDYPLMRDWVNRIAADDEARGARYLWDFGDQLGDWLALDGRTEQSMNGGTDEFFIGSNYWAMSVAMVADAAHALGLEEDERRYRELHDRIREAIIAEWFTARGRLAQDTQTAYVVALMSGIYPNKDVLVDALRTRLYKDCYKLRGGFVGAPVFCRVLADNGMADDALRTLLNEDYPGWLHCVKLGATTIWERWNSVLDDGHLSGTEMNSLNHYAYGAVVEFLYRNVAGLQPVEAGFKSIRFAPIIDNRLSPLHARYESASGTWESSWEVCEDGSVEVALRVPLGCTAEVVLPDSPDSPDGPVGTVKAGAHRWRYAPTRDYRARYTETTLFKDMLDDEEAMAAIREELGLLAFFLDQGMEEYRYETLATISHMEYMGFRTEKVDRLRKRLMSLRG